MKLKQKVIVSYSNGDKFRYKASTKLNKNVVSNVPFITLKTANDPELIHSHRNVLVAQLEDDGNGVRVTLGMDDQTQTQVYLNYSVFEQLIVLLELHATFDEAQNIQRTVKIKEKPADPFDVPLKKHEKESEEFF